MLASAGKSPGTGLFLNHRRRQRRENRGQNQCGEVPAKPVFSERVKSIWETSSGAAQRGYHSSRQAERLRVTFSRGRLGP